MTVTTVYLDRDYLIDQLFWKYADVLNDRLEAAELLEEPYVEPAQVLRPTAEDVRELGPLLDELVDLSSGDEDSECFFRMQALVFSLLQVLMPYIEISAVRRSGTQRHATKPSPPRRRALEPLRVEARKAAQLLEADVARPWTLTELAEAVHLSRSRLAAVFTDAYGKTPQTYLAMKRVEEMARLLRETPLSVTGISTRVGWANRSHAASVFRQYLGVIPARYRECVRRPGRGPDQPESRPLTT